MDEQQYGFIAGAEMHPSKVRHRYPSARFVARARQTEAGQNGQPTWGILLDLGDRPVAGKAADVVTDDDRSFQAVMLSSAESFADPAEALAQARYWELPVDYVDYLRQLAPPVGEPVEPVADEEA